MLDELEYTNYNSYLLIDLNTIKRNVKKIQNHIGELEIIPALKGNAYGFGLVPIAKYLTESCGIKKLACSQVYEAIRFKEANIKADILVLGGIPYSSIPAIVTHDIMVPGYQIEFLDKLNNEAKKQNTICKIHIKIETGMNRIGVRNGEELDELLDAFPRWQNLEVVGAYTHFVQAEEIDKTLSLKQFAAFKSAVATIKERGHNLAYVHASNTAATTWLKDPIITHVRPARLILGFDTTIEPKNSLNIEPSLTWRSYITHIRDIKKGETIGYNGEFKAQEDLKMATIGFGYGDGYPYAYAKNFGDVLINGKRAPLLGICMDQCFVDISHIPNAKVDGIVTLLGNDGEEFISPTEWEEKTGQVFLTSLSVISDRVKRIYHE